MLALYSRRPRVGSSGSLSGLVVVGGRLRTRPRAQCGPTCPIRSVPRCFKKAERRHAGVADTIGSHALLVHAIDESAAELYQRFGKS